MATAPHKVCTMCGLDKTASEYYRDKRAPHGLCTQCRDCMNERKKAKRQVDPEKTRAEWREDYRKHKDRYIKAAITYRAKNLERCNAWVRHNGALSRCAHPSSLTSAELAAWIIEQAKVCHWCGVGCAELHHIDHIIPLSRGGRHELDNIVIACPSCNCRKHTRTPDEWQRKQA